MNIQVTVLKVLVSYPDGFAVMADLKRDVALLATSGRDWSDRTKRLAGRFPELDIFSQRLVERIEGGWQITAKGRSILDLMEARASPDDIQLDICKPADRQLAQIEGPHRSQGLALRNQRRQTRRRRRRSAALKAASPAREGMGS